MDLTKKQTATPGEETRQNNNKDWSLEQTKIVLFNSVNFLMHLPDELILKYRNLVNQLEQKIKSETHPPSQPEDVIAPTQDPPSSSAESSDSTTPYVSSHGQTTCANVPKIHLPLHTSQDMYKTGIISTSSNVKKSRPRKTRVNQVPRQSSRPRKYTHNRETNSTSANLRSYPSVPDHDSTVPYQNPRYKNRDVHPLPDSGQGNVRRYPGLAKNDSILPYQEYISSNREIPPLQTSQDMDKSGVICTSSNVRPNPYLNKYNPIIPNQEKGYYNQRPLSPSNPSPNPTENDCGIPHQELGYSSQQSLPPSMSPETISYPTPRPGIISNSSIVTTNPTSPSTFSPDQEHIYLNLQAHPFVNHIPTYIRVVHIPTYQRIP